MEKKMPISEEPSSKRELLVQPEPKFRDNAMWRSDQLPAKAFSEVQMSKESSARALKSFKSLELKESKVAKPEVFDEDLFKIIFSQAKTSEKMMTGEQK